MHVRVPRFIQNYIQKIILHFFPFLPRDVFVLPVFVFPLFLPSKYAYCYCFYNYSTDLNEGHQLDWIVAILTTTSAEQQLMMVTCSSNQLLGIQSADQLPCVEQQSYCNLR